jgi:hypothetical protein
MIDYIARKMGKWKMIPQTQIQYFYYDIQIQKHEKVLEDGSCIGQGDHIMEIHLNNKKMQEVGSDLKKIFKALDLELKALSNALDQLEEFKKVKAIYARTVLYPITEKRGFEVHEVEASSMRGFLRIWDNVIKYAYEQEGHKIKLREPKEIWISRDKLLSCHLKD